MNWFSLLLVLQQALWIDVPFILQAKDGCGSASIWMVMKYWQPAAAVDVDELQQQLYSREAGGIYAKDMSRYFGTHGYRVFTFRGEWPDLEEQISKGRPLIVSLERNKRGVPLHYVVVAGVDSAQGLVLINDPAQRKLMSVSRADFERDWRATDNWTLLAVPELDLASSAFRDEKLADAQEHLMSALHANPSDSYTNEFLATVYFLQNNTEAALKYWNHSGKPSIENIRIDPPLRTNPVLVDRAFAFSRGSILHLNEFEETQARLAALRTFSRYRLELSPSGDEHFDVTLRAAERSRMNVWSWASGLPFQTVHAELPNLQGKAINLGTSIRWDSNKRRAFAVFETPLRGDPRWGLRTSIDGVDENWASPSGTFRMKKVQATAEIRNVPGARWSWTSGASISNRRFSNSFSRGLAVKYSGSLTRTLVREPAMHLTIDSSLGMEAGRVFDESPARYTKVTNTTAIHWQSFTSKIRIGSGFGRLPFDERFMIGLDRDSDLWLRAHSATVDGQKNASNTSRSFVLVNSDFQKPVLARGWFTVTGGPFVDLGKSSIAPRWVTDTGIEFRWTVLGAFGINVSYGKSLSDNHRSVFVREQGL